MVTSKYKYKIIMISHLYLNFPLEKEKEEIFLHIGYCMDDPLEDKF